MIRKILRGILWASSIAGTLAFVAYAAFGIKHGMDMKKGNELANAFCASLNLHPSIDVAIASAKKDKNAYALQIHDEGMVLIYVGGCHCRVDFSDGRAFPVLPFCND